MKFRWICLLAILALLVPQFAFAWGGEGPRARRLKKARNKASTPSTYTPPPVPPAMSPEHREVVSAVSYYVQFRSKDGYFPVPDSQNKDREWLLKVAQQPTVNKISDTKYQVLGSFQGLQEGAEAPVPVVVDFTVKSKKDRWNVKEVRLHSIDGVEI